MPDDLLHTPLPDRAHEALRVAVMQAIDDLTEQVDRLKSVFLLLSVTGDMAQATKNSVIGGQQAIASLSAQVQAVNTRAEAAAIDADTALANCDQLQTQMADVLDRLVLLESPKAPEV